MISLMNFDVLFIQVCYFVEIDIISAFQLFQALEKR